ncbi:uncharacterized protein yc1106_10124 [Curvularia clavata]|uniref:Uncharacterized protein n=1 Tax=Curvularia clavata TaxID=95742 RepID=A0A9Q8ZJG8_CURCL|nr:uncharacterized protein yc1106_10124 [Curvularia clavata]
MGDPSDSPRCILLSLGLEVEGRPDVVIDLRAPGAVEELEQKSFTIKEGTEYRIKMQFKVQHETLSGLRYVYKISRKGVGVDKSEEMMGSFPPNTETTPFYEKTCIYVIPYYYLTFLTYLLVASDEAPSGALYRGHYKVLSEVVDDDKKTHLQFNWSYDIKKDWS